MARSSSTGTRRGGSKAKSAWARARETTSDDRPLGDAVPVDPGRYRMQLVGAKVDEYGGEIKLMRQWCVIDHEEFEGAICSEWEGPLDDDSRMIWVQRALAALGVDLDEVEYEKHEDLETIYAELIEEGIVANVSVTEKDGYVNMRVRKAIEVDEDLLVDPVEALKGASGANKSKSKGKGKDSEEVEEEEEEESDWEVGQLVTIKLRGKEVEGEITGFTDDDEAEVKVGSKTHVVALDKLTAVEEEEEEETEETEEDEETEVEEEEEEAEEGEITWDSLNVGDRVKVDFGDDGEFEGEVTSKPPKSKAKGTVQVTFDGEEDSPEMIEVASILEIIGEETEEEEEEEAEGLEFEEGDEVTFKDGRKSLTGSVVSVDADAETAKVKVKGERKAREVELDKLSHATA